MRYSNAYNAEVVYFIATEDKRYIKIGTSRDVPRRLQQLQVGNPHTLVVLTTIPGGHKKEKAIQALWGKEHTTGEWFNLTPELLNWVYALGTFNNATGPIECGSCAVTKRQTDYLLYDGSLDSSCISCRRLSTRYNNVRFESHLAA